MAVDLRRQALRRAITELIAFETELEVRLEREQQAARGYSDAMATIERFVPMVQTQRDRLTTYIKSLGSEPGGVTSSPTAHASAVQVCPHLRAGFSGCRG